MSLEKNQYNDTKLAKVYKEFYDESGLVRSMEYEIDPFMSMLGRAEMENYEYVVSGKYVVVPIRNGGRLGSQSKNFADAQKTGESADSAPDYESWQVRLDKETVTGHVDIQTMHASRNKRGSFVKPLLESTNLSLETLKLKRNGQIYRDGSNVLGAVGSKTGKTITLKNKWDAPLFYKGARLQCAAANANALRDAEMVIDKINRKSGVITMKANIPSAVTVNDNLYYKGDFGKLCVTGLAGWIRPSSEDPSAGFMNVQRGNDDSRYAGVKIDASSGDIRDVLTEAPAEMFVETGIRPNLDCYIMHPMMINNLQKEMKSTLSLVRRTVEDSRLGSVAYNTFEFNVHGQKPIDIISTIFIDANTVWGIDKSTWMRFHYNDELVSFDSGDGLPFLRKANDDGIEVRGYSFMGIACPTPAKNCRITFKTGNSGVVS